MTTATYVRQLDAALVGPRRAKRELLVEAGDHLEDATEAYLAAGYDADTARAMAVVDFGSVEEIAPSFQTTLAVASSRRTAWLLVAALSIQPFLWDGPLGPNEPDPDGLFYAVLDQGVEVIGGLMIVAALLLALATGIGNRWFHAGRAVARTTGLVTLGAAITLKVTGVTMMLMSVGLAPAQLAMVLAFLVAPLSLAGASARRTLATC